MTGSDLALDLMLREMEIYGASYQSIRSNIQTMLTIAVTIDAILITSIFSRSTLPSWWSLFLGFVLLGLLIATSVTLMWVSPAALSWPEGFAVGMEAEGSLIDGKRQLVRVMDEELKRVRRNLRRYQRGLLPLLILLVASIASWVWPLKVPTQNSSHTSTTSTTSTTAVRVVKPSALTFPSQM